MQQFRYFKVLIQEFHIKVDIVFIMGDNGLTRSERGQQRERGEMRDIVSYLYRSVTYKSCLFVSE